MPSRTTPPWQPVKRPAAVFAVLCGLCAGLYGQARKTDEKRGKERKREDNRKRESQRERERQVLWEGTKELENKTRENLAVVELKLDLLETSHPTEAGQWQATLGLLGMLSSSGGTAHAIAWEGRMLDRETAISSLRSLVRNDHSETGGF